MPVKYLNDKLENIKRRFCNPRNSENTAFVLLFGSCSSVYGYLVCGPDFWGSSSPAGMLQDDIAKIICILLNNRLIPTRVSVLQFTIVFYYVNRHKYAHAF